MANDIVSTEAFAKTFLPKQRYQDAISTSTKAVPTAKILLGGFYSCRGDGPLLLLMNSVTQAGNRLVDVEQREEP
jgi:hypothetical protein